MTQALGRVRVRRSAATARKTLTRRFDEAYAAWAEQDAVTSAMREELDAGPGDEADLASRRAQLDEQFVLAGAMRSHLDDLAVAIARCEGGSYGVCQGCNRNIPAARLDLFPAATRCVACQARSERR
jgi:DnaK suppressor protein